MLFTSVDDICVVYRYWHKSKEDEVYWKHESHDYCYHADLEHPVLLSMSTLRKWSQVPIYLLDYTDTDWGEFPERVGFSIVKWKPYLVDERWLSESPRMLNSKPFDVMRFSETVSYSKVVFCDSDIFWVGPPFPLVDEESEFGINGNTGLFWFNKCSPVFMEAWCALMLLSLNEYYASCDSELIKQMKIAYGGLHRTFSEEAVVFYMIKEKYPSVRLRRGHNVFYPSLLRQDLNNAAKRDKDNLRSIHFLRAKYGRNRAYYCLLIKELYDSVHSVLGEETMNRIFGDLSLAGKYSLCEIGDAREVIFNNVISR
jgi:hypothetical protein